MAEAMSVALKEDSSVGSWLGISVATRMGGSRFGARPGRDGLALAGDQAARQTCSICRARERAAGSSSMRGAREAKRTSSGLGPPVRERFLKAGWAE
jgi:hypothetical protein